MTEKEICEYLKNNFPIENESVEHKAFRNLKHSVSGSAGEDLISYVSAISNMEGGSLIVGVEDNSLNISGIENCHVYTSENLPNKLLTDCINLPSIGLKVTPCVASDTKKIVWIIHIPKHLPRQAVHAHKKAWQRIGESLIEMTSEKKRAILHEPLGHDWSSFIVNEATINALDPAAIALAREKFKEKYPSMISEIERWSDTIFLDKAKINCGGKITNTALLLLGKSEFVHLLTPVPAQMTWKLETLEEKAYEHFGPPFILTTSKLLNMIRNVRIKLFPEDQLIPHEMMKYETRVILEALHNCIAHQNYEMNERIIVTEKADRIIFQNAGDFFDGSYENYVETDKTPGRYRNHWLTSAMVNIGMIDTMGFGIKTMFEAQRNRFLPLPDYGRSSANHVVVEIFGNILDQKYSRLLISNPDLSFEHVIALDKVQKKLPITDEIAHALRQLKLIEGRKPNYIISIGAAKKLDQQAHYSKNKGFDDSYYKDLILKHLERFQTATRPQLEELIMEKLPEILTQKQKKDKVKNILHSLKQKNKISASRMGKGAVWSLSEAAYLDCRESSK